MIDALTRFLHPSIEPVTTETVTVPLSGESEEEPTPDGNSQPVSPAEGSVSDGTEASSATEPDEQEILESAILSEEEQIKIPSHDVNTLPSAEQKRQYRSLRNKSKKYDWEEEDE